MDMMRKGLPLRMLIVVGATGMLWVSGCHSNPMRHLPFAVPVVAFTDDGDYLPMRVGPGLVAKPDSPIPDVPMPIGFKPVISKSSSSFDGVARTVTHVYQGRGRAVETVLFYRQQIPLFGWEYRGKQVHDDRSMSLHYTKGSENLGIRLSNRFETTTIEVYITAR